MAEVTEAKFGSLNWFAAWGERLANAGLEAVTNTLTAKKTAAAPASDQAKSSGGFAKTLGSLTWLPYAIAAAVVLILVLVLRKRP